MTRSIPLSPAPALGLILASCLLLAVVRPVGAQSLGGLPLDPQAEAVAETPVAAMVGERPIHAGEIERNLKRALARRPVAEHLLPLTRAEILEQLIRARLVEQYLVTQGEVLTPGDLDRAVAKFQRFLGSEPEAFAKFLADQALTEAAVRERLTLNLGWPLFLRRHTTDEALAARFEADRRKYDGTELRVRQIVLAVEDPLSNDEVSQAKQTAGMLAERIKAGTLDFAEAAAEYSAAPTGSEGGELGWIKRHGSLPERVAEVAFELEPGTLGPPVVSDFGVHLVEVLEVRPGDKTLPQVRAQVASDLNRELFHRVAAEQRQRTEVRYTGAVPYLDENGDLQGVE